MRSAAPAGISLLNCLRKRGLACLEPSWSAPLFFWRFSGDFENRVYPLYRRSHPSYRRSTSSIGIRPLLAAWLGSAGLPEATLFARPSKSCFHRKPEPNRATMTTDPIDVSSMISGIQRWVEAESPTSDTAAVNRMVDLVHADVVDLPVVIERVPGRNGFADNLIVRNQAAGEGSGIVILSHIDTVHPVGTLRRAAAVPPRRRPALRPGPVRHEGRRVSGARSVPAGRARRRARSCR